MILNVPFISVSAQQDDTCGCTGTRTCAPGHCLLNAQLQIPFIDINARLCLRCIPITTTTSTTTTTPTTVPSGR